VIYKTNQTFFTPAQVGDKSTNPVNPPPFPCDGNTYLKSHKYKLN